MEAKGGGGGGKKARGQRPLSIHLDVAPLSRGERGDGARDARAHLVGLS